jgi:hypothetical protein
MGELCSMVRRYVQSAANDVEERCEFRAEPITAEHRHLIEMPTRQIICVCRSCSILFDKKAASHGKYRRIPDRRLYLEDFRLGDAQWRHTIQTSGSSWGRMCES